MNPELALEYISRRMQEMGYGKNYLLRFRHILLKAGEVRELTAYSQLFLLIDTAQNIRIESDVGLFDLSDEHANELQYEHRGRIRITNLSDTPTNTRLIQAIPINTTNHPYP